MKNARKHLINHIQLTLGDQITVIPEEHDVHETQDGAVITDRFFMTLREMNEYSRHPFNATQTTPGRHRMIMHALPIITQLHGNGLLGIDEYIDIENRDLTAIDLCAGGDGPHNNRVPFTSELIVPSNLLPPRNQQGDF